MNNSFNLNDISIYAFIVGIFILFFALGKFLKRKISNYLSHREKLIEFSEEYERKRKGRNDLKYHYYWKIELGEIKSAEVLGREILKLDEELKNMYEQYEFLKEKGFYPLKKI